MAEQARRVQRPAAVAAELPSPVLTDALPAARGQLPATLRQQIANWPTMVAVHHGSEHLFHVVICSNAASAKRWDTVV